MAIQRRAKHRVVAMTSGVVALALSLTFFAVGLDDADKLGSVIGAFLGLGGMSLAVYGIAMSQSQSPGKPVLPAPGPSPPHGKPTGIHGHSSAGDNIVIGEIPRRPPAFQPRTDLYDQLAKATDRISVVSAVTGARGVGKTQLAAAYARACVADGWPLVAWIPAEDSDQVLAGLDRLAEALGLRGSDDDSKVNAAKVRSWLETAAPDRCLVVFDNGVEPEMLTPWLPATGRAHIVITTTQRVFGDLGTPVNVDVFTDDEALAFLRERTGIADDDSALALASEVGFLPLALGQSAAVIRSQRLSYATFLARLRGFPIDEYLSRAAAGDYPRSAAQAVLLALDAAERADWLTRPLLDLLAVLSAIGVERTLLHTAADKKTIQRRRRRVSPADVDATLGRLLDASLLTMSVDGDSLVMHRFVQRVIRDRARHNRVLTRIARGTADLLADQHIPPERTWAERIAAEHLLQHVQALWSAVTERADETTEDRALVEKFLHLRGWVLRRLLETQDLTRAIDLGTTLLADCARIVGADHEETLTSRNNLANAYWAAGRLTNAITLHQQTLTQCERTLGPHHPHTLTSRNNLANAYWAAGRHTDAITLHQQTLTDRERTLGSHHPHTLTSRNNLANAYWAAGRLTNAITLHQQTLTDRERTLGPHHPHTLNSRNNLAGAYWAAGRHTDAITLHQQTLTQCERTLGLHHPHTLTSRSNLGGAYKAAGRLNDAITLYEQTLTDCERVLGADHPTTRLVRDNLKRARKESESTE